MFQNKFFLTGFLSASCVFQGLANLVMPLPTLAQTALPTIIPATSQNVSAEKMKLQEIVNGYGLNSVSCSSQRVSSIHYGNEKVCVTPSRQLPAGNYVFNPTNNQIVPVQQSTIEPSTHRIQPNRIPSGGGIEDLSITFNTLGEYIDCVENILHLYEGRLDASNQNDQCVGEVIEAFGTRSLTKSQAYQILDLANFQATQIQTPKFFPPRGIRIRAARLLGYTYELDANDEEIQNLARQERR